MQDDGPSLVINVSGQPQHVLAKDDFTPLDADDEESTTHDWRTMIVPVAMRVNHFCEGHWPQNLAGTESVRVAVIDLGDEFKQHYVAPRTAVGIDRKTGHLQITENGGYIRDDSIGLQPLAKLIYEWYGVERQSLDLSLDYISTKLKIGQLVTSISQGDSESQINAVVTSIKYKFSHEISQRPQRGSRKRRSSRNMPSWMPSG